MTRFRLRWPNGSKRVRTMAISLSEQLDKILEEYSDKVDDTFGYEAAKIAKETVQDLRATSPKSKRHTRKYAEGWSTKRKDKLGQIVYNKTNWQLTHLLNNGHVIANGSGTYGRTSGDNHIGKAEEKAVRKLIDEVQKKL